MKRLMTNKIILRKIAGSIKTLMLRSTLKICHITKGNSLKTASTSMKEIAAF